MPMCYWINCIVFSYVNPFSSNFQKSCTDNLSYLYFELEYVSLKLNTGMLSWPINVKLLIFKQTVTFCTFTFSTEYFLVCSLMPTNTLVTYKSVSFFVVKINSHSHRKFSWTIQYKGKRCKANSFRAMRLILLWIYEVNPMWSTSPWDKARP